MKKEKNGMKDGSNKSDKVACPRSGDEGKNLFDKKTHIVRSVYGGPFVLYINTFCPQQVEATAYCHVPTQNQQLPIKDKLTRRQVQSLIENYATHTVRAVQYNSAVLVRH